MYDFYDDAGHHHRSQCKHWTAFIGQDPSLAGALLLLGTLGYFRHFWKALLLGFGKLCSFGLWAKFTEKQEIISWTNV